jgi:hypothetical protein
MIPVQERQTRLRQLCERLKANDADLVDIIQFGSSVYAPELARDIDLLVTTRSKENEDLMTRIKWIRDIVLIVFLLLANSLYSQYSQFANPTPANIFQESFTKIGTRAWAAGGAYVAERDHPAAAFWNPGGLSDKSRSLSIEAGKRLETDWLLPDFYSDGQLILPGFASVRMPIHNMNFAIGYFNAYDLRMRAGPFIVRTISHPEGTGEVYWFETGIDAHSFFVAGSYSKSEKASVGLTLGLSYLRQWDKLWNSKYEGQGYGMHVIAGGMLTPYEKLNLGAVFRYATNIDYDMNSERGNQLVIVDSTRYGNNDRVVVVQGSWPFRAKFPWSLQIGMSYQPLSNLKFLSMIDFQKWSTVADGLEDKIQMHLGIEILDSKPLAFSLGVFTQDHPSTEMGKFLDQNFLTAGTRLRLLHKAELSLSIIDSHLFPNKEFEKEFGKDKEQFHQTHIASGISFSF